MKTLIESLQDSVQLYAGATETPQAIAVNDWKEVEQLVAEHAALVAVAEAAKKIQYECGKLAFLSHEPELYSAWSKLTNALAVRAGKGVAS